MNPRIWTLYIDRGAEETLAICSRIHEKAAEITLEIAAGPEAALARLLSKSPVQVLLFDSAAGDPFENEFLATANRLGINLPPMLVLQSEEPTGPVTSEPEGCFSDRILKRDGYLLELPFRIRSAALLGKLQARLAERRRIEENLRIHQIELESQNEELKRTQSELDVSRARYFDLYDLAPVGYCTVGPSGLILEANLTFATQLGVTRGALLKRPFSRFVVKDDAGMFYHLLRDSERKGHFRKLELRMRKADGAPSWMLLDVSPSQGEAAATDLRIIVSDISHLKRTEKALRESEAFNSAILDSMVPEIAVLDENGIIVRVNESCRRSTSVMGPKAGGRNFSVGIHFREIWRRAKEPAQDKGIAEACFRIQSVLDGKLPGFSFEYPCEGPDGRQWFILNVSPIGSGTRGAVLSHTDITLHKSQEARLREVQKMLALGTLAGGIAHDFNNLLAIILGNADLARRKAGPGGHPEVVERLGDIHRAGTRAVQIVKQILTFSRGQPTERIPVALGPIVEDAILLVQSTLPGRFELDLRCDPATPTILADPTQIHQAVLNVLTNAVQSVKEGPGRIRVRVDPARLDGDAHAAHPELKSLSEKGRQRTARITISDNGSGMDAATMARIFDPFFTTKPVNEGTGLGLSVVHGIVRKHEGAILVESLPGRGAAFRIFFPEAEGNPETAAPGSPGPDFVLAEAPESAGHGRILFVDDEADVVSVFRNRLQERGYDLVGFTNQEAAIRALREAPYAFDLAVCDFNMPGMSGVDVAGEIRKIREDLPVALSSGYLDAAAEAAAGAAGIRDFLFKVTAVEEICVLMQRLKGPKSYIPSHSE